MADQSSSVEKQTPRELPLVADDSKTVNCSFPILSDSIQSTEKKKNDKILLCSVCFCIN